jgi:hypothetical protein
LSRSVLGSRSSGIIILLTVSTWGKKSVYNSLRTFIAVAEASKLADFSGSFLLSSREGDILILVGVKILSKPS